MKLFGTRGEYDVVYNHIGDIVVNEPRIIGWWIFKKTIWEEKYKMTMPTTFKHDLDKLYPDKLLVIFAKAVNEYEAYKKEWEAFDRINQNGIKLDATQVEND